MSSSARIHLAISKGYISQDSDAGDSSSAFTWKAVGFLPSLSGTWECRSPPSMDRPWHVGRPESRATQGDVHTRSYIQVQVEPTRRGRESLGSDSARRVHQYPLCLPRPGLEARPFRTAHAGDTNDAWSDRWLPGWTASTVRGRVITMSWAVRI